MSVPLPKTTVEWLAWACLFFLAVGGMVVASQFAAIEESCERTCDPYVVKMCKSKMAVCKTPDGYVVRKKTGKF